MEDSNPFYTERNIHKYKIIKKKSLFLSNGSVFANACHILQGHGANAFGFGEFTYNGSIRITVLCLRQFVAVQCEDCLHFATIHGLLDEFLIQFECQHSCLNRRLSGESVCAIIGFGKENGWAGRRCHFANDHVDTCRAKNNQFTNKSTFVVRINWELQNINNNQQINTKKIERAHQAIKQFIWFYLYFHSFGHRSQ